MAGKKGSLADLADLLRDPDAILRMISGSIAEEVLGLIKEGFNTETDPYGRKWAPKQAHDGRKTLSGKTSLLKNGWKVVRQTASEIAISPSVNYANHHQNPQEAPPRIDDLGPRGLLTRPRRMMVPDGEMGLPREWEDALVETATDGFAQIFKGNARAGAKLRKRVIGPLVGFKVG